MGIIDVNSLGYFDIPVFTLEMSEAGDPIYSGVNHAWSEGANRLLQDVLGKTAKEVFPGKLGVAAYEQHLAAFETGQKRTYDIQLPLSDIVHTVRTKLTPVLNDTGTVIQFVGVSSDRTSEFTATKLRADLACANKDIEDFIFMAAHDLRTPMRNIGSLADLLRDGFSDLGDGKIELIDMIEDVATKAADLITDILAHAQAVTSVAGQETFDLSELCNDIFLTLDPIKRHSLKVANQTLTTDKVALQIVLRNLCDNAIKHCGRHNVALNVLVQSSGSNTLEFTVSDNGQGFQDPAITFLDGGELRMESGFGLLGVRRLIESRGGTIAAQNLPNDGGGIVRFSLSGEIAKAGNAEQVPDTNDFVFKHSA
ncbi:MAG: PAS domain-containing sensor histidine kinase [Aliishimia sp.]